MRTALKSRFAAWIALGAMLFTAASPLLAAMRFQGSPEILAQICTLDGIRTADGPPAAPSQRDARGSKHCVFCLNGAWQPPVAAEPAIVAPASVDAMLPFEREDAERLDFPVLQPISPRAPPRS